MLCEVNLWGNVVTTWVVLNVLSLFVILGYSGTLFYYYYQKATYEKWLWKSNPKYPTAEMVRSEVLQTLKGMWTATLCPAISLYLARNGLSQAYCGTGAAQGLSPWHLLLEFLITWFGVDFFEFLYHRLGHTTQAGWQQHKYHHLFYNPSPFAVIADEYIDQFARSSPLILLPLIMPMNMDLMFIQFAVMFYGFGTYLHTGHELNYPDAHHPLINSSFQHYLHHAKSVINKPYHTGFFFKIWDRLFGSLYDGDCFCAKCDRAKGNRTKEAYEKYIAEKPDYSILLKPSFWAAGFASEFKTLKTKSA